jgi:RHS repeat-associated protein
VIDYVNLEGQLVAERSAPLFGGLVTTRYQHADLRGSPTLVTNAGGTQIERSIEQPFGAPYDGIYRDGPGFTGHATDAASGLSYMQQRYYDPIAMRFLSVDPVAANSGAAFSRYSYGGNNPFKYTDPDGKEIKINGDENYKSQVEADLATAKSAHEDIKKVIVGLSESKNIHQITPAGVEGNVNKTTGVEENAYNGEGTGSETFYDPNSSVRSDGQTRAPVVALVHELNHASDTDKGINADMEVNPDTGVFIDEENAIMLENKMREKTGDPLRSLEDY